MRIVAARLLPIRLPLVRPLRTANGVIEAREGTILRLETEAGVVGRGEASPYPGFGRETLEASRSDLERLAAKIVGLDTSDILQGLFEADRGSTARAAVETACLEATATGRGVPLCDHLVPGACEEIARIPCNALIGAAPIEDTIAEARRAHDVGFETLKLKVGASSVAEDGERIAAVREALGDDVAIRLDANGAYDLETARSAVERFAPFGIEYLEQPLPADRIEAMARLRRECAFPLALDEGALDLREVQQAIAREAADVIVIKPSVAGGPRAALAMARAARAAGLGVVVTTLIDSAIGVAAAIHAAAAIAAEGPLHACGLATRGHFSFDCASPEALSGGAVPVPRAPGLGLPDDRVPLERCLAGAPVEFRA